MGDPKSKTYEPWAVTFINWRVDPNPPGIIIVRKDGNDKWQLPGGKLIAGVSIPDFLRQHVYLQTGIHAQHFPMASPVPWLNPTPGENDHLTTPCSAVYEDGDMMNMPGWSAICVSCSDVSEMGSGQFMYDHFDLILRFFCRLGEIAWS